MKRVPYHVDTGKDGKCVVVEDGYGDDGHPISMFPVLHGDAYRGNQCPLPHIANPEQADYILSLSCYDDFLFCSTVKKNNIYGCQYHPEKSGNEGLQVIKNFIYV